MIGGLRRPGGSEGGSAGARARNRGDDDGPVWPHDGCQLVADCPAPRGHPSRLSWRMKVRMTRRPA